MSRVKIRTLCLVLIAVCILLFILMASPHLSSVQRHKIRPNRNNAPQKYRIIGQKTGSVESNGTSSQMNTSKDMQTLLKGSTEKRKIEIEIDMLQRIESLLSDIKHRQDLAESAREVSKEVKVEKLSGQRSNSSSQHVSSDLHVGDRSDLNSNKAVPKTASERNNLFQKNDNNAISPGTGNSENQHLSQRNQDNDLLGKIQGILGKTISKKLSEHDVQLLKQENTKKQSTGNSLQSHGDNSSGNAVCDSCFKNDFKFLIDQESLCKHSGELDLLIAISTTPSNREARDAIRKTWASTSMMTSGNMKCAFFIGSIMDKHLQMQINEENEQYHDIVQIEFTDSYSNLTYKTLSELRWVSEYCPNTKYVMKTDSDMFVNTFVLPNILKGAPKTNFIGGDCWGPSPPHREKSSKWYVSYKSYMHSSFPPMCSGTGYLISKDLVLNIIQTAKNIPFFHLEDVFIALCTKKLNVKPVYLYGFSNMRKQYDSCTYRYRVATSHEISPSDLIKYWDNMQNCPLVQAELQYDPRPYHPL